MTDRHRDPARASNTSRTRLFLTRRFRGHSAWLFNLGAEIYAWFTAQPAWRTSCSRMAELVGSGSSEPILDLGCGPGVSTFELGRRMPGTQVVGLDLAPRMLREARRRAVSSGAPVARISWLVADAARLPFSGQTFNACAGHSFLYLVADRAAVLSEIRRVLRPHGRLVLMEPSVRGATIQQTVGVSRDPRHLLSVSLWRPFSRLHGRFSPDTLVSTLESARFIRCTVEETLGGLGLLGVGYLPE